jgi:hypothetical protein
MSKSIKKIDVPAIPMSMDSSFGSRQVGVQASTMELFFHDGQAGSGLIEWDVPGLEQTWHIGLWWDNNKSLLDYDGVFSLPEAAIELLESEGFTVDNDFRV